MSTTVRTYRPGAGTDGSIAAVADDASIEHVGSSPR
jgi:hypothetical protein